MCEETTNFPGQTLVSITTIQERHCYRAWFSSDSRSELGVATSAKATAAPLVQTLGIFWGPKTTHRLVFSPSVEHWPPQATLPPRWRVRAQFPSAGTDRVFHFGDPGASGPARAERKSNMPSGKQSVVASQVAPLLVVHVHDIRSQVAPSSRPEQNIRIPHNETHNCWVKCTRPLVGAGSSI